jgi:surface protein
MHIGSKQENDSNFGILLKEPIMEFTKQIINEENSDTITIKYKIVDIKDTKKIQLFGELFVETNKNICKIIVKGKVSDLTTYIDVEKDQLNDDILEIKLKGIKNITNMSHIFYAGYGDIPLFSLPDFSKWNTQNVINMSNMFHGCDKLISLDLSSFDTKNVIDMSNLFSYCNSLKNIDLSSFNTENVKNMGGMFYMCENLTSLNLSSFNTQNVEKINEMFCHCENLQNINLLAFNTINVTTMEKLFYNCTNLIEINLSSFKAENVENISRMFFGCKNLENLDLSNFSFLKVNNCFQAFFNCNKLKKIIINKSFDNSIIQKEFKENNIKAEIIY